MTDVELLDLVRNRYLEENTYREQIFGRVKFLWTALVILATANYAMIRHTLVLDGWAVASYVLASAFWIVFILATVSMAKAYHPSRYFKLKTWTFAKWVFVPIMTLATATPSQPFEWPLSGLCRVAQRRRPSV